MTLKKKEGKKKKRLRKTRGKNQPLQSPIRAGSNGESTPLNAPSEPVQREILLNFLKRQFLREKPVLESNLNSPPKLGGVPQRGEGGCPAENHTDRYIDPLLVRLNIGKLPQKKETIVGCSLTRGKTLRRRGCA